MRWRMTEVLSVVGSIWQWLAHVPGIWSSIFFGLAGFSIVNSIVGVAKRSARIITFGFFDDYDYDDSWVGFVVVSFFYLMAMLLISGITQAPPSGNSADIAFPGFDRDVGFKMILNGALIYASGWAVYGLGKLAKFSVKSVFGQIRRLLRFVRRDFTANIANYKQYRAEAKSKRMHEPKEVVKVCQDALDEALAILKKQDIDSFDFKSRMTSLLNLLKGMLEIRELMVAFEQKNGSSHEDLIRSADALYAETNVREYAEPLIQELINEFGDLKSARKKVEAQIEAIVAVFKVFPASAIIEAVHTRFSQMDREGKIQDELEVLVGGASVESQLLKDIQSGKLNERVRLAAAQRSQASAKSA